MERAASPSLEATLLQRWFPVLPDGRSTREGNKSFSETDLRDISDVLRRVGRGSWSRIPRIYAVLRLLGHLDVIDLFLAQAISDVYFPFTHHTLPQSLNPSVAHGFLQLQRVVLSSALDLERETGRHRHFSSTNDVPFIKVEDLGKGAYGYVDRVISTISHKEYARKLIPRGRTFQRDQKILRDFERELGTLKKLRHHRHIVQLVGSYTDSRFVGILMSPVAECDLKDFLSNCASDVSSMQSRKSLTRSFFGCLTAALSYLHDNTIRHKDIKPQNVLVSQHTVYLTDFGISLDWSEIGQSTTTGPTPKTARYCAPEVSDYAPRNTSSDMWSLGCIFLEIWTVLKGESVANLHAYLEANGTLSSCYHLNHEATLDWAKMLELKLTVADNPPQEWIRHLLVEDKGKRWTARQLLLNIETVNANPDVKFAFSGQCCMEELESAESVISSNGSMYEPGDIEIIPQSSPSVPRVTPILDEEHPPTTPSAAAASQPNLPLDDPDANTSTSLSVKSDPDTLGKGRVFSQTASELAIRSVSQNDDVVAAVGNSTDTASLEEQPDENAQEPNTTQFKYETDKLDGTLKSTRPESISAPAPSLEPTFVPEAHTTPTEKASHLSIGSQTHTHESIPADSRSPMEVTKGDGVDDSANDQSKKADEHTEDKREGVFGAVSLATPNEQFEENNRIIPPNMDIPLTRFSWQLDDTSLIIPQDFDFNFSQPQDVTLQMTPFFAKQPTQSGSLNPTEHLKSVHDRKSVVVDQQTVEREPEAEEIHTKDRDATVDTQSVPHDSLISSRLVAPFSSPELTPALQTDVVPYSPPVAPTVKKTFLCEKCFEPLTGQYVRIPPKDQRFHLDCFTCADCGTIVASKFFPTPGKIAGGKFLVIANPPEDHVQQVPLCETDYFRRLELLCYTCGQALRGSYITAMDRKYHIEHFTCVAPGCELVFGAQDSYFEYGDGVYCRVHYAQRAELCHGCGIAIFKQFVEIFRNSKNEHWHPECYMIHKFYDITFENDFADFFKKRKPPKVNGVEVPQRVIDASTDRTENLVLHIWRVLSLFEESCATFISSLIQSIIKSDIPHALSASASLLVQIEKYFAALAKLENLEFQLTSKALPKAYDQRDLYKIFAEFFDLMGLMQAHQQVTQQLESITSRLVHNLKLLLRRGLALAYKLDPEIKHGTMAAFLADIENIKSVDTRSVLQEKFRLNRYQGPTGDICVICQCHILIKPGQGCFWNSGAMYHIDCLICPSCNAPPRVQYHALGKPRVECSRCMVGSMMDFLAQNLGEDFVILIERSTIIVHLLYMGWGRVAQVLRPNLAPSDLILPQGSLTEVKPKIVQDSSTNADDIPAPPSCPEGWKVYWSAPVKSYFFMNLRTGVSQWNSPASDASSGDLSSPSQEVVRSAPMHNSQDPDATLSADADVRHPPLALDDIALMFATEQDEFGTDQSETMSEQYQGVGRKKSGFLDFFRKGKRAK